MTTAKAKQRLTLDAIRDADDIERREMQIPEWGGTIELKALTKGEHQEARFASTKRGQIDADLLEINLLCAGVVDPVLTKEDAGILKRKNAGVLERIMREILKLSKLDADAVSETDRRFRD